MLQLWSGNRLKSTRHRVVVPSDIKKPRQSLAYFIHPNNNCTVTDLENKENGISVNPWDYLMKKFKDTY